MKMIRLILNQMITMTAHGKLKPMGKKKDFMQGGWSMLKKEEKQNAPAKRGSKGWYQDYLKHPSAQYRMSFTEYKDMRKRGKIK